MGGRSGRKVLWEPQVRVFPPHLHPGGAEAWRNKKRTEWKDVVMALERYRFGAAYTPGHRELFPVEQAFGRISALIEQDGWECW